MYKLFLFPIFLFFVGCYSNNSSTTTTINDATPYGSDNTSLAVVPHHKKSIPLLTILLSYKNIALSTTPSMWRERIYGTNEGDLNDYFAEVSYGKFHFTPAQESDGTSDGIVSVVLDKNHLDTDIDTSSFQDRLARDLHDALEQIDDKIDFSLYDTNADGAITPEELQLLFIVAGYEDAYEGRHVTNGIWAHQWCVDSAYAPQLDGVTLMSCAYDGKYAVFGELHDITDPHQATVGIIAHEISHATWDLPDLYNTTGGNGGIGYFGLMGAGMWGQKTNTEYPGATPVHMTAWTKYFIGWITPQIVQGSTTLDASSTGTYNIIQKKIDATSYYLLENRNDGGYDRGLRVLEGHFVGGVALWRINEAKLTAAHFERNDVNNDTFDKGVDLVEAANPVIDSDPSSPGDAKNLFYDPNKTSYPGVFYNVGAPGTVINITME